MHDAYFVNVFRDRTGKTHYSTEEFSVSQSKINSVSDALEDAYQFAVLGDWQYVCTLGRHDAVSAEMQRRLFALDHARFSLESRGKTPENFRAEELEEEAENLCATATLPALYDE